MSWFRRKPALHQPETAIARVAPVAIERRDQAGFGLGTIVSGLGAVGNISSTVAENAASVAACINAVSSSLASLPIRGFRTTSAGRTELPDSHWLPRLLKNPCEQCTWPELAETLFASALLLGNGLATIGYDRDGVPNELAPVPWGFCTPVLLNSGRLAFNVNQTIAPYFGAGAFKTYRASETVFLRDRSDNGWIGVSRLARSPAVIEAALSVQSFSAAVWRNSAAIGGVLSHPGALSPEAKENISRTFTQAYGGVEKARLTPVLEEGMTWSAATVSPMDAETLATRQFTVPEICRIFNVPPSVIFSNENNAFTSSEQQAKQFATLSLLPWARKLEAAIGKSLLADEPDLGVEIDFGSLTRGDYQAQSATAVQLVRAGIQTANEARHSLGLDPHDDGDRLVAQATGGAPIGVVHALEPGT